MINIENLVKDYGSVRAVNRINFSVREGEIVGFLGPNGAGKSTTLKIITCFLSPTEGNISIDNLNIFDHSEQIRSLIGYLPENNPLYTDMLVYDYLRYIGQLRGLNEQDFNKNLRLVIEKCGLWGYIAKPIHTLSKGYRQRVGLAQAIIHDPKILILDEPTSGLDPNQIIEIRELIKELGKEKTLILSSHILQEVQAVCNRIIIINKGDIVADGSMDDLKSSFQGKTKLNIELIAPDFDPQILTGAIPELEIISIKRGEGIGDDSGMVSRFRGNEGTIKENEGDIQDTEAIAGNSVSMVIEYSSPKDLRGDIFNLVKENNWILLEMHREFMSLEDLFRTLTAEKAGYDKPESEEIKVER